MSNGDYHLLVAEMRQIEIGTFWGLETKSSDILKMNFSGRLRLRKRFGPEHVAGIKANR